MGLCFIARSLSLSRHVTVCKDRGEGGREGVWDREKGPDL